MVLPLELWSHICTFTNFDDGYTIRSLAQVSHFFREATGPYRLRTVSLYNVRQIMALTGHLESLPLEKRRVQYLFVASQQDDDDLPALADSYKPGICDRTPGPTPEEILESGEELMAHAVSRLLTAIRTTVRILHLQLGHRDFIFFPIKFDQLEELTLRGSFADSYQGYVPYLPANPTIRRLEIDNVHHHPASTLIDSIVRYAPRVSHLYLRLQNLYGTPYTIPHLSVLLYGTPGDQDHNAAQLDTTLEKLYIHPGERDPPGICGMSTLAGFSSRFAAKRKLFEFCEREELQSRVVLLKEERCRPRSLRASLYQVEGEEEWLSRIHGGLGCWHDSQRMDSLY